jgi:hypothetical protein
VNIEGRSAFPDPWDGINLVEASFRLHMVVKVLLNIILVL